MDNDLLDIKRKSDELRRKMVQETIVNRGVKDRSVIDAMLSVPRERFASGYPMEEVYGDYPLPIGEGQTISQPYIAAYMTSLCGIMSTSRVLEIGTGSGYQTALLAELAGEVYTVERVASLQEKAVTALMDYSNIYFHRGNGYYGWEEHGPYDVILLTASPEEIPRGLFYQLREGGRLVAPVGVDVQQLVVCTKDTGEIRQEFITYVRFVPLVDSE